MSRHRDPAVVPNTADWSWPLRFSEHSFAAFCYDTYGCNVYYGAVQQVADDPDTLTRSSASQGPGYQRGWTNSLRLGVRNFPPPAHVRWRSKDGQAHEAEIDFAAIFSGQFIAHKVPREDIPPHATIGPPSILLEVNDRTINVYMSASIPTKSLQIPGNRYSNFRDEIVLVKSFRY